MKRVATGRFTTEGRENGVEPAVAGGQGRSDRVRIPGIHLRHVPCRRLMALVKMRGDKVHQPGVNFQISLHPAQQGQNFRRRQRLPVGTILGKSLTDVGNLDDPCLQRQFS